MLLLSPAAAIVVWERKEQHSMEPTPMAGRAGEIRSHAQRCSHGGEGDDDDTTQAAASLFCALSWPPRSYTCSFCKRVFRSAQALGGHMNVHRRDRARLRESPPPLERSTLQPASGPNPNPNPAISPFLTPNLNQEPFCPPPHNLEPISPDAAPANFPRPTTRLQAPSSLPSLIGATPSTSSCRSNTNGRAVPPGSGEVKTRKIAGALDGAGEGNGKAAAGEEKLDGPNALKRKINGAGVAGLNLELDLELRLGYA